MTAMSERNKKRCKVCGSTQHFVEEVAESTLSLVASACVPALIVQRDAALESERRLLGEKPKGKEIALAMVVENRDELVGAIRDQLMLGGYRIGAGEYEVTIRRLPKLKGLDRPTTAT
jgi:hypothetical protein